MSQTKVPTPASSSMRRTSGLVMPSSLKGKTAVIVVLVLT